MVEVGDSFCICGEEYDWYNLYNELVVVIWVIVLFVY